MGVQLIDQRPEIRLRADFRIEPIVVDDVVAVRRTWARLHDRRCVDMADAERRQIWHESGRVAKREVAMELQTIGSADRRKTVRAFAHQAAERSRASSIKTATRRSAPPSTISPSVRDKCRCQLGWASVVPGKSAC